MIRMPLRVRVIGAAIVSLLGIAAPARAATHCAIYDAPSFSIAPGTTISVPITLTNCGDSRWAPAQEDNVSYHWYDGSDANLVEWDGLRTQLPALVRPGESVTVSASVRAPTCPGGPFGSQPCPSGTYTIRWDLVGRFGSRNAFWFSNAGVPTRDVPVTVGIGTPPPTFTPTPASQQSPTPKPPPPTAPPTPTRSFSHCAVYDVPSFSILPGQTMTVPVMLTNCGQSTWRPDDPDFISYHWADGSDSSIVEWDGIRTALPSIVRPGETISFEASVRAPTCPGGPFGTQPCPSGSYTIQWDLIGTFGEKQTFWFSKAGVPSKDVPTTVGTGTPPPTFTPVTPGPTATRTLKPTSVPPTPTAAPPTATPVPAPPTAVPTPSSFCAVYHVTSFSIPTGTTISVPITVTNCGDSKWETADAVSYHWYTGANDYLIEWDGLRTQFPATVAPGQSVTFDASVRAPTCPGGPLGSQPCPSGTYTIRWDLLGRFGTNNFFWFSTAGVPTRDVPTTVGIGTPPPTFTPTRTPSIRLSPTPKPPSPTPTATPTRVNSYCAVYDAPSFSILPGQTTTVPVMLTNCGPTSWHPGHPDYLSYHWADGSDEDLVEWDGLRTSLPSVVAPGQTVSFEASVQAPSCPGGPFGTQPCPSGTYTIRWDLVGTFGERQAFWLSTAGVPSKDVPTTVGTDPPPPTFTPTVRTTPRTPTATPTSTPTRTPAFTPTPVPQSQSFVTLAVTTGRVRHDDYLGLSALYNGFAYMPESTAHGMDDGARAIEFSRVEKSRLAVARTYYGSDWAMPVWGGPFSWDSAKMTAFYSWLTAMRNANVPVALNVGWWFPSNTCSNEGDMSQVRSDDPTNTKCTPRVPTDVDIYTRWVAESVKQLVLVRGFTNVRYLLLFTEPNHLKNQKKPPEFATVFDFYKHVAEALDQRLRDEGVRDRVKLVGPNATGLKEDTSQASGHTWLKRTANELGSVVDVFSAHDYGGTFEEWQSRLATATSILPENAEFWLDEYGAYSDLNDPSYGTYISEVNVAAINAGVQNTSLWAYQDQYSVWPLQDTPPGWGTYPWIPEDVRVRPSWQALTMLSRSLNGTFSRVYDSTGTLNAVRIAALGSEDGELAIVLINSAATEQNVRVLFDQPVDVPLQRYLYDPGSYDPAYVPIYDDLIDVSRRYPMVRDVLEDTLPAGGVALYTSLPPE